MPEAPQGALRAVFAGIGRILNVTDKIRSKPAEAGAPVNGTAPAAAPETAAPEPVASETTAPETTASETATPEPAVPETAEPEPAAPEPVAPEASVPETAAPETAAPEPAAPETATPEPAAPETAEPESAAEPPLPNYDGLTIASVRARLRNLSVAQLGQLISYEKANAGRQDFIAMFERRIAKIESEK
jgi:outer membrane biosynthesis protein TonB